jgi:hypothetical protein
MISDWRKKMDLSLPFYFVQLAAYSQDYAEIREAQMVALNLPDVGYAVAIDLGDPKSPTGSIHPRRKQEVGRRLSLSVLGNQYGKDVVTTGPIIQRAFAFSDNTILVQYVPGTAEGLHASGTAACGDCCRISPFEVMDAANGKWSRTDFTIQGAHVELEVDDIKAVAVRYNWEGYPQCAVYNGQGGPDNHAGIAATPFRVNLVTHPGFLALTQETALKESKEALVVDSIKENTVPYDIPEGYEQTKIIDRFTLNAAGLPATFGNWDMISFAAPEDDAPGEYPDAANFIFIPMEVGVGGGVIRYNVQDGTFVVLMQGNGGDKNLDPATPFNPAADEFTRCDAATYTPFNTLLIGEETVGTLKHGVL